MTNIFQICKRMVQAALSSRIPITTCKYCWTNFTLKYRWVL
jgi:hypothetical protein